MSSGALVKSRCVPNLSVVIPHYNDAARLAVCLRAIHRQSIPRREFEVIVADNNTPSGIDRIREEFPDVIIVRELRQGAAHARNRGIREARGSVLAFTDSDCCPDENWLLEGLRALGAADLAGGRVVVTCEDEAHPTATELFERLFAFRQSMYVERKGFAATANLFAARAAFDAAGVFRDGGPEDAEWCRRAQSLGFRLAYAPRAVVRHPARPTWRALSAKWDRLVGQSWREAQPRGSWSRSVLWVSRAVAVGLSPLGHALTVLTSRDLVGVMQRVRCLVILVRIRAYRAAVMLGSSRRARLEGQHGGRDLRLDRVHQAPRSSSRRN